MSYHHHHDHSNPKLSYSVSKLSSLTSDRPSTNQPGNRVPLPERALIQPLFSSAVQFVSTSLKPLTEPSIAYPSGRLAHHLSTRANRLLSSSTSRLPSAGHRPPSNAPLKRARTLTASTHPTSISRKRSKSDLSNNAPSSCRLGSTHQPTHHTGRAVIQNHRGGSSLSLTHLDPPSRHPSRTPDAHQPGFLMRQKQRLGEASIESSPSTKGPYPQYYHNHHHHHHGAALRSSSSLKSSASLSSIGTPYPSRSGAHSQPHTSPSEYPQAQPRCGPVRKTYLGGVGVYLNHTQADEDDSQDEHDPSPSSSPTGPPRPKPSLTINVGLCKPRSELAKSTGNWYSRLLLSPLSSAGSSVYSFLINSASPLLLSADVPDQSPKLDQDTRSIHEKHASP